MSARRFEPCGTIVYRRGSHTRGILRFGDRAAPASVGAACYVCGLPGDTSASRCASVPHPGSLGSHFAFNPPPVLSEENVLRYVRALYSVGLLLILVPVVDVALRAFPVQLGTLQWRFATVGLMLGNYGTIILGTALIGLTAALLGDRGVLRIVGAAALVMAVVTLALLVLFALDAVQLRQLVVANIKRQVGLSSAGAAITGLLGATAWFLIGRSAMTASRSGRVAAGRTRTPSPLVMASGTGDTV